MILVLVALSWLLGLLLVSLLARQEPVRRREWQLDLLFIGGIILGTLAFFWRLIFTGDVWMPAGGGDLAGFLYPTYHFAAEWWRRGVIALWNPQLFAGQPFVGDIQSSLFYPLNLLTFFTSNPLTYRDMEFLSVTHFIIAGVGMFALLRWGGFRSFNGLPRGNLSRAACLAGGIAFEYSDLFITHFGNLNLIASASYLPIVFLFFMMALDRAMGDLPTVGGATPPGKPDIDPASPPESKIPGTRRRVLLRLTFAPAAWCGLFLAFSLLAGHIQSFLFIVICLAAYAAYRMIRSRAVVFPAALVLCAVLAIGLGLSAMVLLPSFEMARASVRSTFTYEDAAQFSLPPAELVGLLIPGFFGRGPQAAWGPWPRVEVGYIGILPLVLAGLSLLFRRSSKTVFMALLALLGLLLALGGYAILDGWLFAFVPGFGQLRAPARFILLLDFGLAVLAAIGLDTLTQPLLPADRLRLRSICSRLIWLFVVVALTCGGGALALLILGQGQDPILFSRIANAANSIAFFILLLGLSVVLLIVRDRDLIKPPWWSLSAIALISLDVFSLGAYVDIGLSDPTAAYKRDDVVRFLSSQGGPFRIDSRTDSQGLWLPDTGLLYGLSDVNGDNPLVLADFDRYWEALGGRSSHMYDLLNTRFVIARRSTPLDAKFQRVFDGQSGLSAYENRDAFPRAWLVYGSVIASPRSSALELVKSSGFDPSQSVILEDESAKQLGGAGIGSDDAAVTGYGPNQIDISADAKAEGYLVLSEVFYPGWNALVDGQPSGVYRADALFRAVLLQPGHHLVRLVYDPGFFKLGAAISGLCLLVVIGGALWLFRE